MKSSNSGSEVSAASAALGSTDKSKLPATESLPPFSKHFLSNLRRMNEFRTKPQWIDAKLRGLPEPGNSLESEPRILAHKFVLLLSSPYFEKLTKKGKYAYDIPIRTPLLQDLVEYMYTGMMPPMTIENVYELLKACQLLELDEAIAKCQDFMLKCLAFNNRITDFLLNNCPPDLSMAVVQALFETSENHETTKRSCQLSLYQLMELINVQNNLSSNSALQGKILREILEGLLADVRERLQPSHCNPNSMLEKETLPVQNNVSVIHHLGAEKHSDIDQQETSRIDNGAATADPTKIVPETEVSLEEKKRSRQVLTPKTPKVTIKKEKLSENADMSRELLASEKSRNDSHSSRKKPSNPPTCPIILDAVIKPEPISETPSKTNMLLLKGPQIQKPDNSDCKNIESLKRRSNIDGTPQISGKAKKIRLDATDSTTPLSERLKELANVTIKTECPYEGLNLNFEVGSEVEGISPFHPLMFYLCEEATKVYSVRAYDFMEKKSAVVIENAWVDRYNYGVVMKGQTLLFIGGRNDHADFLGSNGQKCLPSVISFDNFPNIDKKKIRLYNCSKNSVPNYANQLLKEARSNFGSAVRGNRIFVIGGHGETNTSIRSLRTAEMCDNDGNWKFIAPMKEQREQFGLACLNSKIYVAGGLKAARIPTALNSVEEYVTEMDTWNPMPSLHAKGIGTRLVTANKTLYALEGGSSEISNNFEMLDTRVGKWFGPKCLKTTSTYYHRGAAATSINGNIYSIGGSCVNSGGSPMVELLDPRNEKWCIEGDLPKGGMFTSVCFMNN